MWLLLSAPQGYCNSTTAADLARHPEGAGNLNRTYDCKRPVLRHGRVSTGAEHRTPPLCCGCVANVGKLSILKSVDFTVESILRSKRDADGLVLPNCEKYVSDFPGGAVSAHIFQGWLGSTKQSAPTDFAISGSVHGVGFGVLPLLILCRFGVVTFP